MFCWCCTWSLGFAVMLLHFYRTVPRVPIAAALHAVFADAIVRRWIDLRSFDEIRSLIFWCYILLHTCSSFYVSDFAPLYAMLHTTALPTIIFTALHYATALLFFSYRVTTFCLLLPTFLHTVALLLLLPPRCCHLLPYVVHSTCHACRTFFSFLLHHTCYLLPAAGLLLLPAFAFSAGFVHDGTPMYIFLWMPRCFCSLPTTCAAFLHAPHFYRDVAFPFLCLCLCTPPPMLQPTSRVLPFYLLACHSLLLLLPYAMPHAWALFTLPFTAFCFCRWRAAIDAVLPLRWSIDRSILLFCSCSFAIDVLYSYT